MSFSRGFAGLRRYIGALLAVGLVCFLFSFDVIQAVAQPVAAFRAAPPAASISAKVNVPASMRSAPFDVDRYLTIPANFSISVYARVSGARFMTFTPDGNLLVSQPGSGKVSLVRPNGSGDPLISDFVTGLSKPHDLVFHTIGNTTYLYVSETNQINRYTYSAGNLTGQNRQVVVSGLPDASLPELHGSYGHELKNIGLGPDDKLYVSIASTCNACTSDTVANPVRGALYQYNADGTGGRLFARGLRNAEGLAFVPGTNTLWVAINNRDNIACPAVNTGEGCNNVGDVSQAYVDNHPPEEFTKVTDGANYGWPFCNPNPDTTTAHVYNYDNMPFQRDQEYNANGSQLDCSTATHINKGIQAHSAPLGLTFLQNTQFASAYRNGAVIALHGSWNRATKTGAKVIYFPWDSTTQLPGAQQDLVSGWIDSNQNYWGRPVDTAVDSQGNLFISDDNSGTIYKLSYTPATIKINFQPAGAPVPGGYLADTGAVYGDRGNGYSYGWNADNAAQSRDRNASNSPDQRYDTLSHLQKPANPNASWEIAVPNGQYQVHLVSGDPGYTDSVFKLNVEGTLVVNGTPTSANHWVEGTQTVTVSDGRLTITNATGSSNNKVCYIEITPR